MSHGTRKKIVDYNKILNNDVKLNYNIVLF